jgi:hypothetical protein
MFRLRTDIYRPIDSGASDVAIVGASSVAAALADDSDSSYVHGFDTFSDNAHFAFPNVVIPAGATIWSAQERVRMAVTDPNLPFGADARPEINHFPPIGNHIRGGNGPGTYSVGLNNQDWTYLVDWTSPTTIAGPLWLQSETTTDPITVENINDAEWDIFAGGLIPDGTNRANTINLRVYAVYLDVTYVLPDALMMVM